VDESAYKQLLICLKKCELNYHAHTREFGKLGKMEIQFWAESLEDYKADKINRAFTDHIKESSFFPTVKDIRQGTLTNPKRKACEDNLYLSKLEEDRKLLPAPQNKSIGMPDNMKNMLYKLQKAVKTNQSLEDFRAENTTTIPD
jgi:hypothetical protein